jgi:hypothetical protein
VVEVQGCAGVVSVLVEILLSPPVLQWPAVWTGMSVSGLALAVSLSIQILREVLGCRRTHLR